MQDPIAASLDMAHSVPTASVRIAWPRGLALTLFACLAATLLTWALARAHYATNKRRLLIIGDSVVSNYRAAPGARVEDVAQSRLGGDWSVQNFGESGSRIGDYYLLLAKAELFGFRPDVTVIELNPSKLVREFDAGPDLDEDGRGLMWLPLDREGLSYAQGKSAHFRDVLPLRKASLVFGFYEGLRSLWLEKINWPARRRAMLFEDKRARVARMRAHAIELGQRWSRQAEPQTYQQFLASPRVHDLDFLVLALARRGSRSSILLPPWPNQSVVAQALSPQGKAVLEQSRSYLLRYCSERNLPVTTLDDPKTLSGFSGQHWDDFEHLRSAHAYSVMGEAIAASARGEQSQP